MKVVFLSLFVAVALAAPTPLDANGDPVELIVNGIPEGHPLEVSDVVDVKVHQINDGQVVSAADLLHPLTAQGIAETAAAAAAAAAIAEESKPEPVIAEYPINGPIIVDSVMPEPIVLPSPALPEIDILPVVLPSPSLPNSVPEPVASADSEFVPSPIILPAPASPEVVPSPIVLPSPAAPEIVPSPIVLPAPSAPEVVPSPIVLPAPATPEIVPAPIVLPSPAVPVVDPAAPELVPDTPAAVAPEVSPAQVPQGQIYNDGIVSITVNTAQAAVSSTLEYLQSWYNVVINYFYNGQEVGQHVL